jgi:hypothetical protein
MQWLGLGIEATAKQRPKPELDMTYLFSELLSFLTSFSTAAADDLT